MAVLGVEPTELRVRLPDLADVLRLRTAVAAYLAIDLDIARPKALLSSDNLRTCVDGVRRARQVAKPRRFTSFRLSAAGSDSPELLRFRTELERLTGLPDDPEDGDMLLRLRRSPTSTDEGSGGPTPTAGWQLLVRLTPRPLSARPWRVANYPGALNATIAAAMIATTEPSPEDRFIDLMCGSGTLVVERLSRGKPLRLAACDISPEALDAARANQRAAKLRGKVEYILSDARRLTREPTETVREPDDPAGAGPFDEQSFDRLVVNLPWGELTGSHETNEELYPDVLREARRLATADARFCVLTHDIRRFERSLETAGCWSVGETWRFFQKGHRPKLYLLAPLG